MRVCARACRIRAKTPVRYARHARHHYVQLRDAYRARNNAAHARPSPFAARHHAPSTAAEARPAGRWIARGAIDRVEKVARLPSHRRQLRAVAVVRRPGGGGHVQGEPFLLWRKATCSLVTL